MYAWWAEVVVESSGRAITPPSWCIGLRYGFIMFIMSEVMFFVSVVLERFLNMPCIPWAPKAPAIDGVWPPVWYRNV